MHETHLPRSDSLPTKIGGSAGARFTTLHPKCALQAPRWKVAWSKCMRMSCLQRFQRVSLSLCFVGRCFMCSAFFFACHNSFIQFNGNMQIYNIHIFIYYPTEELRTGTFPSTSLAPLSIWLVHSLHHPYLHLPLFLVPEGCWQLTVEWIIASECFW